MKQVLKNNACTSVQKIDIEIPLKFIRVHRFGHKTTQNSFSAKRK